MCTPLSYTRIVNVLMKRLFLFSGVQRLKTVDRLQPLELCLLPRRIVVIIIIIIIQFILFSPFHFCFLLHSPAHSHTYIHTNTQVQIHCMSVRLYLVFKLLVMLLQSKSKKRPFFSLFVSAFCVCLSIYISGDSSFATIL